VFTWQHTRIIINARRCYKNDALKKKLLSKNLLTYIRSSIYIILYKKQPKHMLVPPDEKAEKAVRSFRLSRRAEDFYFRELKTYYIM